MGKIKIKQIFKRGALAVLAGFFTFSFLYDIYFSQTAYAANGNNFALFVGNDVSSRTDVANAWKDGDQYSQDGWKTMRIYAKKLLGKNKVTIPYNERDTTETACAGGLAGCSDREPVFMLRYYCAIPSGKITFSEPSGQNARYYRIDYGIALKNNGGDDGNAFVGKNTFNAYGGVLRTQKNTVTGETTHDVTVHTFNPDKHLHDGFDVPDSSGAVSGSSTNNGDKWGISDSHSKCRPGPGVTGQMDMKNFSKLSTAQKRQFVNNPGNPPSPGDGGDPAPGDEQLTDCDAKLLNPLSWIICPVIDLGANGSDFIFQKVVEPLLSDIPLSTDPEDDFFQTWQGFRFLANIILVGGMLGIVYSMARGDK